MRNLKLIVSLDSFSKLRSILAPLGISSRCIYYTDESCKITVIVFGYMLPNL